MISADAASAAVCFARPKSMTLTVNSSGTRPVIMRLEGLMSRCTTPASWATMGGLVDLAGDFQCEAQFERTAAFDELMNGLPFAEFHRVEMGVASFSEPKHRCDIGVTELGLQPVPRA